MSEPPWFQRLEPASFRGVPFGVLSHERAGGRRGPDHEFPDSDVGAPEDTGGKIELHKIDAFVVGDDYDIAADNLAEALRIKGPGILIHPRYGSLSVICRDWARAEEFAEGGIARFSLAFTEAPTDGGLTITIAEDIDDNADALVTAVSAAFADTYGTTGWPGSVSDAALVDLAASTELVAKALLRAPVDSAEALAALADLGVPSELIADPTEQAAAWAGVLLVSPLEAIQALVRTRPTDVPTGTITDLNELQRIGNTNAQHAVIQRQALAEYARQAVPLVEDTFQVYDDAIALRDELADLIRAEEAITTDATEYEALIETRTEVYDRITAAAAPLVRLRTITIKHTINALVLAWDLYEDATRAVEIIDRNAIRHGGFIAAGTSLQVLAE
jgi:prophage DNA circulation protein